MPIVWSWRYLFVLLILVKVWLFISVVNSSSICFNARSVPIRNSVGRSSISCLNSSHGITAFTILRQRRLLNLVLLWFEIRSVMSLVFSRRSVLEVNQLQDAKDLKGDQRICILNCLRDYISGHARGMYVDNNQGAISTYLPEVNLVSISTQFSRVQTRDHINKLFNFTLCL